MGEATDSTTIEVESIHSRIRAVRRDERDVEKAMIIFLCNH
jgi:hypothetical protein